MCTHSHLPRSGHCRAAQNQLFCRSRKRSSPMLEPHCPVPIGSPTKVTPENKGSLRFTAGSACYTPLLAPSSAVWPFPQARSGLTSLVGMQLDDGAALSSKSWPLPLPGAQLHGPTGSRAEEAQPAHTAVPANFWCGVCGLNTKPRLLLEPCLQGGFCNNPKPVPHLRS